MRHTYGESRGMRVVGGGKEQPLQTFMPEMCPGYVVEWNNRPSPNFFGSSGYVFVGYRREKEEERERERLPGDDGGERLGIEMRSHFFVYLVSCLACSTREKKRSEDEAALAKLERSKAAKEGERREVST